MFNMVLSVSQHVDSTKTANPMRVRALPGAHDVPQDTVSLDNAVTIGSFYMWP